MRRENPLRIRLRGNEENELTTPDSGDHNNIQTEASRSRPHRAPSHINLRPRGPMPIPGAPNEDTNSADFLARKRIRTDPNLNVTTSSSSSDDDEMAVTVPEERHEDLDQLRFHPDSQRKNPPKEDQDES